MDAIRIKGGHPLIGTIEISGAKNAALPLMAASLLTDEELILENVPALADIETMACLLSHHGVEISNESDLKTSKLVPRKLFLKAQTVVDTTAPYDLVRTMRASILVLGPLVARERIARVSLPGGCAIGSRPIDLHLSGLASLGAEVVLDSGYVEARAPKGLKGARVVLPSPSVGATENILMAAVLAHGETEICNVAREPEISDLARCLVTMGAQIRGIGSDQLFVTGKSLLKGGCHKVIPDRIEMGTYAMAAAMTQGNVFLRGGQANLIEGVIDKMQAAGASIIETGDGFHVSAKSRLEGVDVITEPFPGFPTDLLAGLIAEGETLVNRVYHIDRGYERIEEKLADCGADIERVKF